MISLSATISKEVKDRLNNIAPCYEWHITTSEAIEKGILPAPEIRIVEIELDDRISMYEAKTGKMATTLTARKYYDFISTQMDYWKGRYMSDGQEWQKNKWMQEALKRKRFVGNYKSDKARKILKEIKNRRAIIFCASVDQAKKLGGTQAIHSKNTTEKNKEIIKAYNDKEFNKLFTCQMLTEGMNLVDTEICTLAQLDGVERTTIQRIGRGLRSENPLIYIIVCKNTNDEKYLSNFDIDKKYLVYE